LQRAQAGRGERLDAELLQLFLDEVGIVQLFGGVAGAYLLIASTMVRRWKGLAVQLAAAVGQGGGAVRVDGGLADDGFGEVHQPL
jgi:hypothetical protein